MSETMTPGSASDSSIETAGSGTGGALGDSSADDDLALAVLEDAGRAAADAFSLAAAGSGFVAASFGLSSSSAGAPACISNPEIASNTSPRNFGSSAALSLLLLDRKSKSLNT